jgi:hypothetical protein
MRVGPWSSRQGRKSGKVRVLSPSIACIRRIAFPVRAEATKHVLPGSRSLGRPAKFAAVGAIWEISKLGGLNVRNVQRQSRNLTAEKSRSRKKREADPRGVWGRPMTPRKKQASALGGTVGIEGRASEERIAEITSGRSREQQRLVATCKDSSNEAINQRRGELDGTGE